MRVLAVDPGVSTGWVSADVDPDGEVTIREFRQYVFDSTAHAARCLASIAILEDVDVLVIERFDLRPGNKFQADLSPVEVRAGIETILLDRDCGCEIVLQTPAQAKGLVKNENLKNLGWYPTGKDVGCKDANDVRDAFRHLVYYLRHNKELMQAGWPQ